MYYPLLRWKAGEMRALENAPHDWSDKICPIWFSDNIDSYQDLILGVRSIWSGNQIIDLSRGHLKSVLSDFSENLIDSSLQFAISFEDFNRLNGGVLEKFLQAPVFRVSVNAESSVFTLSSDVDLQTIFGTLLISPLVIIDVGYISEDRVIDHSAMANTIDQLYALGVGEIVLTGGSFPISLDGYIGTHKFPRRELMLHRNTVNNTAKLVSYSDYCTLHPDWEDGGVLRSNHSALKYTIDEDWLVIRQNGKDTKALHGLAKLLCLENEFIVRTRKFSWADDIWFKRSLTPPETGPGNSTFHVSEFIHHHIAQVLKRG